MPDELEKVFDEFTWAVVYHYKPLSDNAHDLADAIAKISSITVYIGPYNCNLFNFVQDTDAAFDVIKRTYSDEQHQEMITIMKDQMEEWKREAARK